MPLAIEFDAEHIAKIAMKNIDQLILIRAFIYPNLIVAKLSCQPSDLKLANKRRNFAVSSASS
jgi:hypothetical protein